MLELGQDISFMALVIMGMISDLPLGGKLMSPPIKTTLKK